jgi:hypothetical protein
MKIIGIDNGKLGGIVVMENRKIIEVHKMPLIKGKDSRPEYNVQEIINHIISYNKPDLIILEKAQVSPIAGKMSCFGMGYCLGLMTGIASSLNIPFKIVHAKTWQKEVLRDINGTDTKQKSILFCNRMFPETDWKLGHKKELDGLTDAACLAYYGFMGN